MEDNKNKIMEIIDGQVYDATVNLERAKALLYLLGAKYGFDAPTAPQADAVKDLLNEWGIISTVFSDITDKLEQAIAQLDSIKAE